MIFAGLLSLKVTVELVTAVLTVGVAVTEAGGGETEAGVMTVSLAPGVAVAVRPLVRAVSTVRDVVTEPGQRNAVPVTTAPLPQSAPPALLLVLTVRTLRLAVTASRQWDTLP